MRRSAGNANIGCLVVIAIIGVGLWVGFKIGRVYYNEAQLNEKVAQQAQLFQIHDEAQIRQNIIDEAAVLGIELEDRDIEITYPARKTVDVVVTYDVDVAFPLDKHFRKAVRIQETVSIK